jgi:hypothetical protein
VLGGELGVADRGGLTLGRSDRMRPLAYAGQPAPGMPKRTNVPQRRTTSADSCRCAWVNWGASGMPLSKLGHM